MPKPKPATPTIRPGNAADIPAIHRVHSAAIRGLCATAYSAELIEAWASNQDLTRYRKMFVPSTRCLVAVADGAVCGFGSLELPQSRLASLFVQPEFAGIGLGRQLLHSLEQLAREAEITTLKVQASLNAQEFYAKHGYRLCKMSTHCNSNGLVMDCAEMEKPLNDLSSDSSQIT